MAPIYYSPDRTQSQSQPCWRHGASPPLLAFHSACCSTAPAALLRTITVFDVQGVGIRDLAGDAFDFLRRSAHLIQEHYPERGKVIMIVNSPGWFRCVYRDH